MGIPDGMSLPHVSTSRKRKVQIMETYTDGFGIRWFATDRKCGNGHIIWESENGKTFCGCDYDGPHEYPID